jgi:hypothetical protein
MPKLLNDDTEVIKIAGGGSFQFSAVRPENLGATEYTLVTIVTDVTGSVAPFSKSLLEMIKFIVAACKKSPRAENLLLRVVTFNYYNQIKEIHGFKLLNTIEPNDYKLPRCDGMTALYDASYDAITASLTYSKSLIDLDFNCNGCIYIITDGVDNNSQYATKNMIKEKLANATKSEVIESLITILIGIDAKSCKDDLERFQKESNLTQFIDVGDATPQNLAKLAGFVSKSISSTSQALGTGAASQPLTF